LAEEFNFMVLLTERGSETALTNAANIVSVLIAVVFAYFINKLMVFQTKCESFRALWREMRAFFASRGLTTLFAIAAYTFCINFLKLPAFPSKLVITMVVILLNYILSVTVVFIKGKKEGEKEPPG
jgi:putative flippase GtrA